MRLNKITKVERYSPLHGKVSVGERLLAINGNEITDVLDYKFWSYDARLDLELEDVEGRHRHIKVRKDEGADLGLEFETYLMDRARGCANHCLFCFVDQLPRGMRSTLYFKDDDARLSFLTGNYITLTNLSTREIQRICDLRVSPIHVSVHATEPELRTRLLGNPNGAKGLEIMKKLAAAGIVMECQIVCCPGLNDGQALLQSMKDLEQMYPQVNSVSIVPVGLTKHREGLPVLTPFDPERAAKTIDLVENFSDHCLEKHGSRIFFCSDELYLKAGRSLPEDEYYEEYSQLENGVGMLRLLMTEFLAELRFMEADEVRDRPFTLATGVSAAPYLEKLLLTAQEKCDMIHGKVQRVENDFFGHSIDVAGLITGRDLIDALRGKVYGERLLISQTMLRHGEGVFLDDVTLTDVEQALGVPVEPVPQDGGALLRAMFGVE
jgi:putative radical SAM enzyme (TIGR03279 family)